MAMRMDNIMTLVSINSAASNAGANEYFVSVSGIVALSLLMVYDFDELQR